MIKRLYDWVLSWAHSPYGAVILGIMACVESFIFPIPPDVLLIALCLGFKSKALRFAMIASAGSVIGAVIGYWIGHALWWQASENFSSLALWFFNHVPGFHEQQFFKVQGLYDKFNVLIVFIAAFTPIPFKIITISAGAFNISFPLFMAGSLIGRAARFFLVALLLKKYGTPVKDFIDKYFNLLTLFFVVLLISGFLVIKFALE